VGVIVKSRDFFDDMNAGLNYVPKM
jgi:hypothetical protein